MTITATVILTSIWKIPKNIRRRVIKAIITRAVFSAFLAGNMAQAGLFTDNFDRADAVSTVDGSVIGTDYVIAGNGGQL